jgi:hypothetical protein
VERSSQAKWSLFPRLNHLRSWVTPEVQNPAGLSADGSLLQHAMTVPGRSGRDTGGSLCSIQLISNIPSSSRRHRGCVDQCAIVASIGRQLMERQTDGLSSDYAKAQLWSATQEQRL